MKVPFLDIKKSNEPLKSEFEKAFKRVLENNSFAGGEEVSIFERNFANFCETKYAAGTSNGTDSIKLALDALGIQPGDEVIIPANTFIATAEGISHLGAKPVLVDANPKTLLINTKKIEERISKKTKAIIPVHLYGQPADMNQINQIAKEYKLSVVEDACQAHGAVYQNKIVGSIGDIGCFSFYPGKNLGALGDAGACTTNNIELYEKIQMLKDHGSKIKYKHEEIGYNNRMDGLQGAFLDIKLKHLNLENIQRQENAQRYFKNLEGITGIEIPSIKEDRTSAYHLYVIQVENRDNIIHNLGVKGIQSGIHYPKPIHLHQAYTHLGYKEGDFPISEKAAKNMVSLPMFGKLSNKEIDYVCENLISIVGNKQ